MSGGDPTRAGEGEKLPQRFGSYRVEGLIGAGGMGVVYHAVDEALQRPVALKTLLPALAADAEFVARFKREAQSAAALNHPNITQIYAIGQEGSIPFFAMEFIRGGSLEGLLKDRGPLEAVAAAGFIAQAARGLRHAAQKELIHRDIKPSNLMLTEDGTVKITDFGLAKAAKGDTQLTATGQVLGSPGYISPEQAQGQAIDARSDIYSLGATFYHLVTGRLPFDAPTPVAMIIKHMNEPLRSPRALNPSIPYPIAACIQKMMAKRPNERFQDYDALLRDLERAMAASPQTAPVAGAAATPVLGGRTWSGMTGVEGRPARSRPAPPPDAEAPPARSGRSIFPVLLLIGTAALAAIAIAQHRQAGPGEAGADRGAPRAASVGGIQTESTFTTQPAGQEKTFAGSPGPRGGSLEEGLRQRFAARGRANLVIASKDHEILPDGRLRYFGRVRNAGANAATNARIKIQILDEGGRIVAQAESPLAPPTLQPESAADFSVPIDYSGAVGTIRAELAWDE